MTNRIIFAYLGAFGLPLLLLPLAVINTMGGHSLMYVSIFSSPVGLIAALSYSDIRRQYETKTIMIRSAASLVIFMLFFVLIAILSEAGISTFLKNQGWILMILVGPLIAAIATEKISTPRIEKKSNGTHDNRLKTNVRKTRAS